MFTRPNSAARTLLVAFLLSCGGGDGPTVPPLTPTPAPEPIPAPTSPAPEPRECTDEWERAFAFVERNYHPASTLLDAWNRTPFRFYVDDRDMSSAEAKWIRETAEDLSDRIWDQIGYRIFEVQDRAPPGLPEFDPDDYCAVRGGPGEIIVSINPVEAPSGAAAPRCAVWWFNDSVKMDSEGTVAHETFHLFGFKHPGEYTEKVGIAMSSELMSGNGWTTEQSPTYEDVDALRCVFPN